MIAEKARNLVNTDKFLVQCEQFVDRDFGYSIHSLNPFTHLTAANRTLKDFKIFDIFGKIVPTEKTYEHCQ